MNLELVLRGLSSSRLGFDQQTVILISQNYDQQLSPILWKTVPGSKSQARVKCEVKQ